MHLSEFVLSLLWIPNPHITITRLIVQSPPISYHGVVSVSGPKLAGWAGWAGWPATWARIDLSSILFRTLRTCFPHGQYCEQLTDLQVHCWTWGSKSSPLCAVRMPPPARVSPSLSHDGVIAFTHESVRELIRRPERAFGLFLLIHQKTPLAET